MKMMKHLWTVVLLCAFCGTAQAHDSPAHMVSALQYPTPEVERAVRYSALLNRAVPAAGNTSWTKLACCLACIASNGPDPTDGLTCVWCWYSIPGLAAPDVPPSPFIPFNEMKARVEAVLPDSASDHGFRIVANSDTTFSVTNTGSFPDTAIVSALEYEIPMHPGLNLRDAHIAEPKSQVLEDIKPGETRQIVLRRPRNPERTGFMVGVLSSIAFDKNGNGMAGIITKAPSGKTD